MKKSEWSDKQITDLLSEFPKIQDHRHPNDIYQKISSRVEKRKRTAWIIPGFAAIAAVLLLFLITPGLLKNEFPPSKQNSTKTAGPRLKMNADNSKKELQRIGNKLSTPNVATTDSLIKPTALYENEAVNSKVLTYWIADKQAQNLIPITLTVLPESKKSWIDLLNRHMTDLQEEKWGLSEYYPLHAILKWDQRTRTVTADVPTNHPYAQGSNSIIFQKTLQNIVRSNSDSKKILLTTNGKPGILFGDFGLIKELDTKQLKNRAYYFYYASADELPYLVPSENSYNTIKEALVAMDRDFSTARLQASLGAKFPIIMVSIGNDKTLSVTMKQNVKMANDAPTLYSYEALLMTAKDFGLDKVKIINAPISHLGPFNLQEANKVPLGANYRPLH